MILMYIFGKFYYSRLIVFGTILTSFALELFVFIGFFYAFRFHKENKSFASTKLITQSKELEDSQSPKFFLQDGKAIPAISDDAYIPPFSEALEQDSILMPLWKGYLQEHPDWFDFINDYLELTRFSRSKT